MSFARFIPKFSGNYKFGQVALGGAVGVGAGFGLKWLNTNVLGGRLPAMAIQYSPLLGGVAAGALLIALDKNKSRGMAHAAGAVLGGVAVQVYETVRTQFPALAGYSYYVPDRGYNALIPDTGNSTLNGLAQLQMSMPNVDQDPINTMYPV